MNACPECGKQLPWGTAFMSGEGVGLPDKRELDCPYCGAPLEPIRWTALAPLFLVIVIAIAARKLLEPLIEPLLDWRTLVIVVSLVAAHHIWAIRRWRKARREQDAMNRLSERDD
jgi:hypothetical protein